MYHRTTNPFLQLLLVLAGLAVMGVALVFGAVLLVLLLGAGAMVALVVWIRLWLLRGPGGGPRRPGGGTRAPGAGAPAGEERGVIEGEFRVRRRTGDTSAGRGESDQGR